MKSLLTIFVVLALAALSAAQDGAKSALQGSMVDAVGLPGQGWTSIGNLSPIEHNNFYYSILLRTERGGFFHLLGINHGNALRRAGHGS